MNDQSLETRVRAVIAQAFETEPDALPAEPDADNVKKWDSLGHMVLIESLQEAFEIELDHSIAVELLSAEAIVDHLRTRLPA